MHSKRAVWLAVNSDQGDRLVEIAREHIELVKEILVERDCGIGPAVIDVSHDIICARIERLRRERNAIIQQFEEMGEADGQQKNGSS